MSTQAQESAAARAASFPPKTVLVPLDFTPGSEAALHAAELLAGRWGAHLRVVHVDQGPPPSLSQGATDAWTRGEQRRYEANVRRRLDESVAGVAGAVAEVVEGAPSEQVPRLVAEAGADLVVMGAHRARGLRRLLGGSMTERALHAAHVPVLTVPARPCAGWPSRILAPVLWTSYADRGLLAARDWARETGASLAILHVYEPGADEMPARDALRGHVRDMLAGEGPAPEWLWCSGSVPQEVERAAREGGYDLVVMAGHAHGFWHDAFAGTTADQVLRRSDVPLLAVPDAPWHRTLGG